MPFFHGATRQGYIGAPSATARMVAWSDQDGFLVRALNSISLRIGSSDNLVLGATTLELNNNTRFRINLAPTTGQGANAHLSSGGSVDNTLFRVSSSRRYKTDIEDLDAEHGDAIYDLRPVWYRSTCEDDRKDWGHYGLIAEEVAEVDPALVFWDHVRDDDGVPVEGAGLRPEAVQYDRLVPHLLRAVQQLKAQLGEIAPPARAGR